MIDTRFHHQRCRADVVPCAYPSVWVRIWAVRMFLALMGMQLWTFVGQVLCGCVFVSPEVELLCHRVTLCNFLEELPDRFTKGRVFSARGGQRAPFPLFSASSPTLVTVGPVGSSPPGGRGLVSPCGFSSHFPND